MHMMVQVMYDKVWYEGISMDSQGNVHYNDTDNTFTLLTATTWYKENKEKQFFAKPIFNSLSDKIVHKPMAKKSG